MIRKGDVVRAVRGSLAGRIGEATLVRPGSRYVPPTAYVWFRPLPGEDGAVYRPAMLTDDLEFVGPPKLPLIVN